MIKTIFTYVVLGLLWSKVIVGCVDYGFPVQSKGRVIDEELVPYVDSYYGLLDKTCSKNSPHVDNNISIKFVPDNSEWIGLCMWRINGFQIYVNARFWNSNKTSDDERKLLMYHELSHCVLGQPHIDDEHNYMYPSVQPIPEEVFVKQVIDDMEKSCN